jgi:hypothetical protein
MARIPPATAPRAGRAVGWVAGLLVAALAAEEAALEALDLMPARADEADSFALPVAVEITAAREDSLDEASAMAELAAEAAEPVRELTAEPAELALEPAAEVTELASDLAAEPTELAMDPAAEVREAAFEAAAELIEETPDRALEMAEPTAEVPWPGAPVMALPMTEVREAIWALAALAPTAATKAVEKRMLEMGCGW